MESYKKLYKNRIVWLTESGKFHRVDGPAIEYKESDEQMEWWIDGKRHRVDGPAIAFKKSNAGYYYINDIYYSKKEDWFEALTEEQQVNYLFGVKSGKL